MSSICLTDLAPLTRDTVVCLGTFDGVHRGHQALIARAAQVGREQGLLPCAYTFDAPPAAVLTHQQALVLTPMAEKASLMERYGIDQVVYSHFDEALAAQDPRAFFEETLLQKLRARHLVIGFHYRFGKAAAGNAALIQTYCEQAGIGLSVIPPVRLENGELVSSTAIRGLLRAGKFEAAREMLGHGLEAWPQTQKEGDHYAGIS